MTTDVGCVENLEGGLVMTLGIAGFLLPPTYQKGLADAGLCVFTKIDSGTCSTLLSI